MPLKCFHSFAFILILVILKCIDPNENTSRIIDFSWISSILLLMSDVRPADRTTALLVFALSIRTNKSEQTVLTRTDAAICGV